MSSGISFQIATRADNARILGLLRDNPMGGRYSISLEREPDAFAAPAARDRHAYILARSPEGDAIGLCERLVRPAFVNGRSVPLPYLTALRVAKSHRNRIGILKGGFRALREQVARADEFPCALTSIAADNDAARRVLTAGLKGLPTYRPTGSYSTLVMRPRAFRRNPCISLARSDELPELANFLQRELSRFQFAPMWSEAMLRSLPATYLVHRSEGEIKGCISLWDQRAVRQPVVRGYPRGVNGLRPAINLLAPLLRQPTLPPLGRPISHGFLSHLAVSGDEPEILLELVRAGLTSAAAKGLGAASLGIASAHPCRQTLSSQLGGIHYETLLYLVHWAEGAEAADACDDRLPMPDAGLL